MLSPEWPYSRVILWVALAALIALLVFRAVRKDRREYDRFKRFERTRNRQRMMRKWLLGSLGAFGGSALVILVLAWRYVPLLLEEVHDWGVSVWWRSVVYDTGALMPALARALAATLVVGTPIAVYLARRSESVPTIGDIGALLPRNRAELRYGALLSLNAGVVEELVFRLAVPALVFGASGNAVVAIAASVVLFGALHIYQGVAGIVGSTLIGGFLMLLYLVTGTIAVPIVAHVLIDLRSLVLIPVLVYRVHRVGG